MTSSCVDLNVVTALDQLNKILRFDQHGSDRMRYLFYSLPSEGFKSRITQHKDHAQGINFLLTPASVLYYLYR